MKMALERSLGQKLRRIEHTNNPSITLCITEAGSIIFWDHGSNKRVHPSEALERGGAEPLKKIVGSRSRRKKKSNS